MQAAPSTGYVALTSQVGGHPGVMSSEDGSLLIKPALPVEVNFYQTVLSDPHFEPLRPFIPKFYGTLRLEGALDHEKNMEGQFPIKQDAKEIEGLEKDSIVLENLSHTFLKPNILDVKLGTVLYDESASEEKRARMEKTARETTSLETGVRLTGFQVYDTHKDVAVNTPKSYGKSIKASDLPDGIARFFPVVPEDDPTKPAPTTTAANSPDADPATGTGLPKDLLLPILESLREDIAEIRTALANVEMRMVGGSLLIVYEADLDRARAGLTAWLGDNDDEDEDDEDDEDEDDEDTKKPGPPYVVKLIDFAHTRLAPGEGPDQGVLLGVDTVLKLLDGRIDQVKALA